MICVRKTNSVARQSPGFGKFPKEVHSRNALLTRQGNNLATTIHEEWISNSDKSSDRIMLEGRERLIELQVSTGVDDLDLLIERLSRRLHHTQLHFCVRVFRVYEHRKARAAWDQLAQNLDPFGFGFRNKQVDPGRVAARLIEACDQTQLYW